MKHLLTNGCSLSDRMIYTILFGITKSFKKICATFVDVICAVSIALLSLLYLQVMITTDCVSVMLVRHEIRM